MAITIGTDGFSEAADVSRLTGQQYDATSIPNTIDEVEAALNDAFALIEGRLIALGIGPGPYADEQLLKLMKPISSRLAASSLLFGQGDSGRGTAYFEQAEKLLAQLQDGLDTTIGDESRRGRSYAGFGPGAVGAPGTSAVPGESGGGGGGGGGDVSGLEGQVRALAQLVQMLSDTLDERLPEAVPTAWVGFSASRQISQGTLNGATQITRGRGVLPQIAQTRYLFYAVGAADPQPYQVLVGGRAIPLVRQAGTLDGRIVYATARRQSTALSGDSIILLF